MKENRDTRCASGQDVGNRLRARHPSRHLAHHSRCHTLLENLTATSLRRQQIGGRHLTRRHSCASPHPSLPRS